MRRLVLPANILKKKRYLSLSGPKKSRYIKTALMEILRLNPAGATASEIDKATYFGYSTIWNCLKLLAARAECFRMEHGNAQVFHFNNIIASIRKVDLKYTNLNFHYSFDIIENIFGKFIRIQRHTSKIRNIDTARNGIIIPLHLADDIIKLITKIKEFKKAELSLTVEDILKAGFIEANKESKTKQ